MPECVVAGLKVRIDRDLCVGFGDCMDVVTGVFQFDDDGVVVFQENVAAVDRDVLVKACICCPVDALIALDEEGQQLAP